MLVVSGLMSPAQAILAPVSSGIADLGTCNSLQRCGWQIARGNLCTYSLCLYTLGLESLQTDIDYHHVLHK